MDFFKVIFIPVLANIIVFLFAYRIANTISFDHILHVIISTVLGGIISIVAYLILCRLFMPKEISYLATQIKHLYKAKREKIQIDVEKVA